VGAWTAIAGDGDATMNCRCFLSSPVVGNRPGGRCLAGDMGQVGALGVLGVRATPAIGGISSGDDSARSAQEVP
jgi:hypothetical protein